MSNITFKDILNSHGHWSLKLFKLADYFFGFLIAFLLPKQNSRLSFNSPIKKILVIRPGGIGDAVFLLPIFKLLKAKGVMIDVLCEPRNFEIFSSQDYPVYFYNRLNSLKQVMNNVYDVVIDTEQWHYLSAICSYFVKAKYRIGFATRPLRAKLFNQQVSYGEGDYELENFLRLFEKLFHEGSDIKNINDCFEVTSQMRNWAIGQITENSVIVFLGASIALRRFTREQSEKIIHSLLQKGVQPVFLGGVDVKIIADQIVSQINDSRVLNFVGRTNLMESAALIQRARGFIGHDSGLMHLACAVGTPVVAIFGPGNLRKWQPMGKKHHIVSGYVSCSPCTKFGYTIPTCKGTYHCVRDIKKFGEINE